MIFSSSYSPNKTSLADLARDAIAYRAEKMFNLLENGFLNGYNPVI